MPGLGARRAERLEHLEPEHLEEPYERMQKNRSAAGTAHHTHRTIRVAPGGAVRRGHVTEKSQRTRAQPTPTETEDHEGPR
ncbi:hypothetical protein GCM10010211_41590 [Streptomyces albospinus]|uniref:Transposase n=1 Tax=Streptomyces albospinus TaxID=285515 RepID=A0ABQ2V8S7_9ACTN|nr:hypothetical protein GCM10010211_41590 [Streptomyces albospinus]